MKRPGHMQRFEDALQSESPGLELWKLAHALRDEGVPQLDLYLLYEHYFVLLDDNEPKQDPILNAMADTMDIIWGGGWAKGHDLYPQVLKSEEIKASKDTIKPQRNDKD